MAYSDDELQQLYGDTTKVDYSTAVPNPLVAPPTSGDVPFKRLKQIANIIPQTANVLAGDVQRTASYIDPEALTPDYLESTKNPIPTMNVGPNTGIADTALNTVVPEIASWMVPYEGALKGAKVIGGVSKLAELPLLGRIAAEALAQGGANALSGSTGEESASQGLMGAASGVLQQALPRWQRILPLIGVSALGSQGNPLATGLNTAFNLLPGGVGKITQPKLAPSEIKALSDHLFNPQSDGTNNYHSERNPADFSFMDQDMTPVNQLSDPMQNFGSAIPPPSLELAPPQHIQPELPLTTDHTPPVQSDTGLRLTNDIPEVPTATSNPINDASLSLEGRPLQQQEFPLIKLQSEGKLDPNQSNFSLVDAKSAAPDNQPELLQWRSSAVNQKPPNLLLEDAKPRSTPVVLNDLASQMRNPKVDMLLPDPLTEAKSEIESSPSVAANAAPSIKQTPVGVTEKVPVVKRAKDFSESGNYEVTLPNGVKKTIFRDPENGWWYRDHDPGEKQSHYTDRTAGFTKKEAVDKMMRDYGGSTTKVEIPEIMTPSGDFMDVQPKQAGPHIISTVLDEGDGQYLAGNKWNDPHQNGPNSIVTQHIENITGTGKSGFLVQDQKGAIRVTTDRAEAMDIARAGGQTDRVGGELHSQDLRDPVVEPKVKPDAVKASESLQKEKIQDQKTLSDVTKIQAKIDEHLQEIKNLKEDLAEGGDPSIAAEIRARTNTIAKMRRQLNGEGGFVSTETQLALAAGGITSLVAYKETKGDVGATIASALIVAGLAVGGAKAFKALREIKGPELKPMLQDTAALSAAVKIEQFAKDTTKNAANLAVGGRGGIWPAANQMVIALLGLDHLEAFKNANVRANGFVAGQIERLQNALDKVKRIQPTTAFNEAIGRYIRGQLADTNTVQTVINNGGSILAGEGGAWNKLSALEKAKYPEKWMTLDNPNNTNTKGDGVQIWHVTNDTKRQLVKLQEDALQRQAMTPEDLAHAEFAKTFRSVIDSLMQVYHDALPPGAQRNRMVGTMGQWITRSHAVITDPAVYPTEQAIQNAMTRLGILKEKDFFSSVGATQVSTPENTTAVSWNGGAYYVPQDKALDFQFLHSPESLRGEVRDYITEIKQIGALKKQGGIPMDSEQFTSSLFSGRKELDTVTQALLETHNAPMDMVKATINKIIPAAQVGHFMQDAVKMIDPANGFKIAMDGTEYNQAISDLRKVIDNPISVTPDVLRDTKNRYQDLITYSKMPQDVRFGLGEGMYVSQGLKTKIKGFDGTPYAFLDNSIGRSLHWFNQFFRTTHLSLSPASISRQVFQAPLMMAMGGVRDANMVRSAFNGYLDRSQGVGKWMNENGVFSASALHGDFNVSLEDILNGSTDQSIWGRVKQGIRGADKLFTAPDDVVRASVFLNEAKRAAERLGVPLESFDPRVADSARQFMLRRAIDFSNLPQVVKIGREIPFINIFLAYSYEIARVSKNMAVDAAKGDLQAGATLAGMATLPFMLQRMAEDQLSSADKKQWDAAKNVVQDYSRPRFKLPIGRNANGSFQYFDITSIMPFNDYQLMARAALQGDSKAIMDVNPLAGFDKSPFLSLLAPQVAGEDLHSGRKFREDSMDRIKNVAQQLLPSLTPGIGMEYQKDVPEALGGDLEVTNLKNARTNTTIGAFMRNVTGIDFTQLNPDIATKNFVNDAKSKIANERQYLMDVLKSDISVDAKKRATARFQDAVAHITLDMQARLQLQPN